MDTILNLVRPNILKLTAYSSARDEYQQDTKGMLFMDANENPFENGVNRYPDPQQYKLKEIIAKQKGISKEKILLGNGSDEVLDLIFRAFCEPGRDAVISLPPTYGMYKVLAAINNVENKEVLLNADFQPDVPEILKAGNKNTKILFVCSPNNPTGNAFNSTEIETLLTNFNGIVVIDEAYIDFYFGDSWIKKLNQYPNLIITQTLSKAYGMAGIRLGICYASTELIEVFNKIKPPYNINELTQQKALDRIQDTALVKKEVGLILEERTNLINSLRTITVIEEIYPTDANFVLVKVDDATKRYKELLDKGIVIRNRTTQARCENTLRFTVGTRFENEKLLDALRALN